MPALVKRHFSDGNGYIDTNPEYRHIGRYIWNDHHPYPQWKEKPIYQWTATELYGLTGDEFDLVFKHVKPYPGVRTLEQRIADDLYWKRISPYAWHHAQKNLKTLPRKSA